MASETNAHDPVHADAARAPRIGRRRLLASAGLGAAALTVLRTGSSAGAVAGQLNGPGAALEPASRITTTTSTTSTTTTTTSTTTVPLEPGQIRFPILVGPDDSCFVGDNFGACRSGCSRRHEGVDMMADQGLPVIAVVSGTLTKRYEDSGSCSGAGNGWTLVDTNGDVTYKFFHLDSHAEGLEVGDQVEAGQIIGYVGETGTSGVCSSSFNNFHLHFEYRPNNIAADSYHLLERPEHVDFV